MTRQDKITIKSIIMKSLTALLLFVSLHSFAQVPGYKIVYNVFEDTAKDNYDIYSMNMDGSGKKNITNTPGVEWVYYTYEDRVFFISDRDTCHRCYFLYEMDADGNHVKKLSDLQLEDSWMGSRNKGTEMIVLGRIGKQVRNQLFLIDLKDGSYKQLTHDTVSSKRDPIFLPGGQEIVLAYRPDRSLRRTVPDELWKMKLDGSNKIQLTHFPKEDTTTEWFRYHAGPPQWNSKYEFISYVSRQKRQNQVYAVTPDGKKQWQITSGDLSSGWHSWSPDGEWLAMDKSTHNEKGYDIYLMNYKTGKTIRLTDSRKIEQAPCFVEIKK
jgi:TolB protein